MLNLIIVQAKYGDCFILEFGTPTEPMHILVDGGPRTIYERHLKSELERIRDLGGNLKLAMLSHIDTDHVVGLLDLLADIREQRANELEETIAIHEIWHNSFQETIDRDGAIQPRLATLLANAGPAGQIMTSTGLALDGIAEGNQLRLNALALNIDLNPEFNEECIAVDSAQDSYEFGNLTLRIVGPTEENLEELRQEWIQWAEENEERIGEDPSLAEMADRSVPNLSSIMVLAEADDKTILLTGDGRGDHLLQGLQQVNLLDEEGRLHVDVFKIPHHGSDRNVTREFFRTITANQYVVSANGRYGNPDLATLIWVVEAAREQNQEIDIFVTTNTPASEKLLVEYPPEDYGYHLVAMDEAAHSLRIALA
jgi:beta-lactamase superfamily II metal-dependent hydrolase